MPVDPELLDPLDTAVGPAAVRGVRRIFLPGGGLIVPLLLAPPLPLPLPLLDPGRAFPKDRSLSCCCCDKAVLRSMGFPGMRPIMRARIIVPGFRACGLAAPAVLVRVKLPVSGTEGGGIKTSEGASFLNVATAF